MKTSRFTDSQIIAMLKQAGAGTSLPERCRDHGISSATFYVDTKLNPPRHREAHRTQPNMSGCKNRHDEAVAVSFFSALKSERTKLRT